MRAARPSVLLASLTVVGALLLPAAAFGNGTISYSGGAFTYTGSGNGAENLTITESGSNADGSRSISFDRGTGPEKLDESDPRCGLTGPGGNNVNVDVITCTDIAGNPATAVSVNTVGGGDTVQVLSGAGETVSYAYTVNGGIGNDTITMTAASSSTVNGGDGNDTITGGAGADMLNGELGNDPIVGGDGNDRMRGGADADTFAGGNGLDRVLYDTSTAGINVAPGGGANDDDGLPGGADNVIGSVESITGSAFNDTMVGFRTSFGGDGDDTMTGTASDDFFSGVDGVDTYNGLGASDRVTNTTNTSGEPISVTLDGNANDDDGRGGLPNENYVGIEGVFGGAGDDVITGGTIGVELHGRDGADTLTGGSANDLLFGEGGTDDALICQTATDVFNPAVDTAAENIGGVCGSTAQYNPNGTFTPIT